MKKAYITTSIIGIIMVLFYACGGGQKVQSSENTTTTVKKVSPQKTKKAKNVNWLGLDILPDVVKKKPKKVFITLYTDWCTWCKKMDDETYKNPHIIEYLNKNYHSVRFNGEMTDSIEFLGELYKFIPRGSRGYNELAASLLDGKLSYPAIVFLDEDLTKIQSLPGYKDPRTLDMIINYFGSDSHKTTPWGDYKEQYVSVIEPAPEEEKQKIEEK